MIVERGPAPGALPQGPMDAYEDSSYNSTSEAELDSDPEDPEKLLNEWLGELDSLTVGLENVSSNSLRPLTSHLNTPRIDSYRFSMANLEESQDVDLDAILGELCALETHCTKDAEGSALSSQQLAGKRSSGTGPAPAMARTDSPDNDSAFSDNVSMLSSESSASSGGSGGRAEPAKPGLVLEASQMDQASRLKAEKIRIALEKMKEASVKKLFIKAFSADGSTKSLLVDEKMTCAYVTRLLADKNHVQMDPKWAVVEHLPDLFMERVYEDHELLVENLMMWTRDSKNKLLFLERPDKTQLFTNPELFLLSPSDRSSSSSDFDDHSRNLLLEDFFSSTGVGVPEVEGPLYLKSDSKKGWKKHSFVLRASGLYYWPKEKAKSSRDLVCLATLDVNQVYYGLGWKKKYKAPTDFCFAIKHPRLQQPKSTKFIKFLCAEDESMLQRWMVGIRLAKCGRQLMDSYRSLMDELAQDDLDRLAHARSYSLSSIAGQAAVRVPCSPSAEDTQLQLAPVSASPSGLGPAPGSASLAGPGPAAPRLHRQDSGRSRASSSSSSGCLSDGAPSSCEVAFECDFPTGTIKRKPSVNPKLPLTPMTRQLKEVGETVVDGESEAVERCGSPGLAAGATLTRNGLVRQSRRRLSTLSGGTGGMSAPTDDASDSLRHHGLVTRGSLDSNCSSAASTPVQEQPEPAPLSMPTPIETPQPLSPSAKMLFQMHKIEDLAACPLPCMTDSILSLPSPVEANQEPCEGDNLPFPPPPPDMFQSTLSLDSLPPPPPPSELPEYSDLGGSSLSLLSLPPPPSPCIDLARRQQQQQQGTGSPTPDTTPTNTPTPTPTSTLTHQRLCLSPPMSPQVPPKPGPRPIVSQQTDSNNASNGSHSLLPYLAELKAGSPMSARRMSAEGNASPLCHEPSPMPLHTSAVPKSPILITKQRARTLNKKISFAPEEVVMTKAAPLPSSPMYVSRSLPPGRKPCPPKRSESTRLSNCSPKKLSDADSSVTPPPKDFLKDLQRIMKKKWQVAQKCKLDQSTTPHEVLGFRDPMPPVADYRETNVSNWVQEHYGHRDNLYENVYLVDRAPPPALASAAAPAKPRLAPPPPPPASAHLHSHSYPHPHPHAHTSLPAPLCMHVDSTDCYRPGPTSVSVLAKKRPPPPPPKRSETTQLTTRLH